MITNRPLIIFVLCSFFTGCSSYVSRYYFKFDTTNQSSGKEFKETVFGRYNQCYEDSSVKLYLDLGATGFGYQLENKLTKPIRIIWDSAKVVLDYERIYRLCNRIENISNEFLGIKWENKKDTILCSILNKSKNEMLYNIDSGFVAIGKSFKYYISDIGLRNYKDGYIDLKWGFYKNKILLSVINLSKLRYSMVDNDGTICLNGRKEYYLSHLNKDQEKLILPDSSDPSFSKISELLQLRKEDSRSNVKPTIILAKSIVSDEMIPAVNEMLPYANNDYYDLNFSSRGFKNCKLRLIMPIKTDAKVKHYSFPFKIIDYQILRKG